MVFFMKQNSLFVNFKRTKPHKYRYFFEGLDEVKEFTALEETTGRPYNQVLLNMYSGGDPLGFGIGIRRGN